MSSLLFLPIIADKRVCGCSRLLQCVIHSTASCSIPSTNNCAVMWVLSNKTTLLLFQICQQVQRKIVCHSLSRFLLVVSTISCDLYITSCTDSAMIIYALPVRINIRCHTSIANGNKKNKWRADSVGHCLHKGQCIEHTILCLRITSCISSWPCISK
jgi:hypothetical protein